MFGKQIISIKLSLSSVVNEHSVITNIILGQIGHFTTQIDPVITNPGYNERRL